MGGFFLMKIVFAAPYFLMDPRDGGAGTVRNMLRGLSALGHDVFLVTLLQRENPELTKSISIFEYESVNVVGLPVYTAEDEISSQQCREWFSAYMNLIDLFKPDWVLTYGGQILDMHVSGYARYRGIQTGFLLLNLTYTDFNYYLKDIDALFADSVFTANYYQEKFKRKVHPIGVFIKPENYASHANAKRREYLTFINALDSKGGRIMSQIIFKMLNTKSDMKIRVINGRGSIKDRLSNVCAEEEEVNCALKSIEEIDFYENFGEIIEGTRLLIVPSLQPESYGMVVVEAKLNGVPSIVADCGGLPEAVGAGGDVFAFKNELHIPPYDKLLDTGQLEKLISNINRYFDDDNFYTSKSKACHLERKAFELEARSRDFETLLASLSQA